MRKTILLIGLLSGSYSYAFIPKHSDPQNKIYCPAQIACATDGDIKSCKPVDQAENYWDITNLIPQGKPNKGIYILKKISTWYQLDHAGGTAECDYNNFDSGFEKLISIYSKEDADIEAFYDKTTKWNIIGYQALCSSTNTQDCPLSEKNEFVVNPHPQSWLTLRLSANGNSFFYGSCIARININDISEACGSVKQCEIDIKDDNPQNDYGSFTVDLSTMQIVQISPKTGMQYKITKNPDFNSIDFVQDRKAH